MHCPIIWANSQAEIVCIFTQREIIRIYHKCEGRIEKSVSRIAVWQHKACRVMKNSDPEGRIFLSYRHTNNGFYFLPLFLFIYLFIMSFQKSLKTQIKLKFQMMTLLDILGRIAWVR